MTLEEAIEIADKDNLNKDTLNRNRGCYYRTKLIESIDTPDFIERVEDYVKYQKDYAKKSDEVWNWFKKNKLSQSLRAEFDLDSYLVAGIVPMKDMEEGYYLGKCRNSNVAYWNPRAKMFEHTREKWNFRYVEKIPHLEEIGYIYDMFIPIRKMDENELSENDKIENWKE